MAVLVHKQTCPKVREINGICTCPPDVLSGPSGMSMEFYDSSNITEYNHKCNICLIPLPDGKTLKDHKKTHIGSAIARR